MGTIYLGWPRFDTNRVVNVTWSAESGFQPKPLDLGAEFGVNNIKALDLPWFVSVILTATGGVTLGTSNPLSTTGSLLL